VFFKLIKVHLLVSELYIYQNARCNDKKTIFYYLESVRPDGSLQIEVHFIMQFGRTRRRAGM